jgi:hypothetical protein
VRGLQQLGWTVGKNAQVDYRLAGIDADNLRKYAAELVALAPDVILAQSSPAIAPLLQATRTVPIVFTLIADPVGAGYVDSLAHPGGNATGFTVFEYSIAGKWLELLKEIAPRVTRVAVFREAAVAAGPAQFSAAQTVAPSLGMELRPVDKASVETAGEPLPYSHRLAKMSRTELIIQLLKVAIGRAFGAYFVWWSLQVLDRLTAEVDGPAAMVRRVFESNPSLVGAS